MAENETRTVWKYPLADLTAQQKKVLPRGSQPLYVRYQAAGSMVWVLVDPDEQEKETWTFWTVMTGQGFTLPQGLLSLGTAVREDWIVLHFFAALEETDGQVPS